jgi:vacuolar-type H+-ATPase subunit H
MDENEAIDEEASAATPIFGVYRRGYDPEQVDRYVGDQQRRLDEAIHRASESERKLAAAVGQLRELHRRVAVYESEARNAQPPQLDTLGERVQRILQEAWEGAYNLRQEAEREVNELREQTQQDVEAARLQARTEVEELREVASREAAEVVDEATRRALHIRDETERRRQAYLERVERDREQAIGQITYLYDQRQGAIAELARLQATVQATIEEMVRSPLGRPAGGVADAAADGARASRAASSRVHPAAPSADAILAAGPGGLSGPVAGGPSVSSGSGLVIGERPPVDLPIIDPSPGGADRPSRPDSSKASIESPHLPGILGSPSSEATEMTAGVDVPTGPMERFVRPSDRAATRSPGRKADAEANAMERVMSEGPSSGPADPAGAGVVGPDAHPAGLGLPSSDDLAAPASGRSGAGKAGAMLGGLIRPRRQPLQQGVYDAEADT